MSRSGPKALIPLNSSPPRPDFLGEALVELKATIANTMENCTGHDCGVEAQSQKEQRHNNDTEEYYEVLRTDVAEIARMAAAERQESASHTIEMLTQLRRIVEENHLSILSSTDEIFQNLTEVQRVRHAEVLRTIQENRRE